jgi:outer membrane receptor protein involved in Fe transport
VLEQAGLQPVQGVQLLLIHEEGGSHQTLSDRLGYFQLEVPTGRYQLSTHHLGYQPYQLDELLVQASRLSPLRILLQGRQEVMEAITVVAAERPLAPSPAAILFSAEQLQRTPATFWDPARYVATAPGITTVNDQANHISVRGLPPWAVQWRLQGVPILNPNHLANAGTLLDRAAFSGGGVNIMSGQLLGDSRFWQGYFPAAYGGALGGIFDMRLRPGATDKAHHTLQAGLLGLDAATEGPLGNKGAAYLVNYRYSTVGLLGDLGVDFGNESIRFQDLSFHLSSPLGIGGQLSFWGMGGLSRNTLSPIDDAAAWEEERDALSVTYQGSMGALGSSLELPLRSGLSLTAALAYSQREDKREELLLLGGPTPAFEGRDQLLERLLSARLLLAGGSSLLQWQVGLEGQLLHSEGSAAASQPEAGPQYAGNYQENSLAPFGQLSWQAHRQWTLSAGLRTPYWRGTDQLLLLPRLAVDWQALPQLNAWLHLSREAQALPGSLQLLQAGLATGEHPLPPAEGLSVALGQQYGLREGLSLSTEVFYHQLRKVAAAGADNPFHALSLLDDLPLRVLTPKGEARIGGLTTQLHQQFRRGYVYRLNGSLLHSRQQIAETSQRLRYDPGWASTLVLGREWRKEKENIVRRMGVFTRSSLRGGHHLPLLDAAASQQSMRTRWDYSSSRQLPAYFTLDIRLSHIREKTNYTRTWSLDLQNMAARKNLAGYYYDRLLQEEKPLNQMGLIPILAYRVEF